MQPNNNRAPGQAGEPAAKDASHRAFAPGDSFVDDPSGRHNSSELPSWLQNFADTSGEPGAGGKAGGTAGSQQQPAGSSWDDPSSVAATRPQSSDEQGDPFGQAPAGSDASFLSEDDLPEWLRALSTDHESSASAVPAAAVTTTAASSVTTQDVLQAPSVSRAWVTAADQADVAPGANLLSSLVNVIDSRPDAVAIEPASASAPPRGKGSAPAASPSAKPATQPKPSAPIAAASSTQESDAARQKRIRLLLLAALVILGLLVIVLLVGN